MSKYLFISFLLSITNLALGQSSFGLRSDFGVSRFYGYQDELKIYPTAQSGFFYEINRGEKSFLGAELLFTQIKRKEESKGYAFNDSGDRIGTQTHYFNYDISYLSIPLYYGVKFNNIAVNLGVVPTYRFLYYSNRKTETTINGVKSTEKMKGKKYKSSIANDLDIGARIAVAYQLNDRINLAARYYMDFNRLLRADMYVYYSDMIDQATLGIRYALSKQK